MQSSTNACRMLTRSCTVHRHPQTMAQQCGTVDLPSLLQREALCLINTRTQRQKQNILEDFGIDDVERIGPCETSETRTTEILPNVHVAVLFLARFACALVQNRILVSIVPLTLLGIVQNRVSLCFVGS